MTDCCEKRALTPEDFEALWGEKLSPLVRSKIEEAALVVGELSVKERDRAIRQMVDVLLAEEITFSGSHRLGQWERGWGENLSAMDEAQEAGDGLIPRYFAKYPVIRWDGELYRPVSEGCEYRMLAVLQYWLFEKYFKDCETICEFGCGTGHNLIRLREICPQAALWGLDWTTASQQIIEKYAATHDDDRFFGKNFDFFNPDESFDAASGAGVYTVAALEQIGADFEKVLAFLLDKKPGICVHIEPIGELLNQDNLLEYLSVKYFEKRNYLNGYLDRLRELETEGRVEIIEARRSFVGSLFIEGYSIIVWRPL